MTLSNEKIKVIIQKKSRCVIELEVEASAEIVKEARRRALKEINKEVSITGFRKGKASEEILLKKYPDLLKENFEKKIADLCFIEAYKAQKPPEVSAGTKIIYKFQSYSLENGAKVIFTYETDPEVPAVDPKAFKLKAGKKAPVTDKEVDEAIRQLRFFYAKWNEADRPVQEGDFIIIDLDSLETDPPARVFSDTRFEVSDAGMAQWMKNLVIGAKALESLKGISKPDHNAGDEEKEKFEPKKVLVTIKKIEEATLPELNDELAKKIGASTVEQMKQSVKNMLIQKAEAAHNQENRKQVSEFLLNTCKFEIPESLIKTEVEYKRNSYLQNPEFKKKYDKMSDQDRENFESEVQKHSEQALRIFYISKKIVSDFDIKISDEEIMRRAVNILYKETGKKIEPKDIPKDIYALAFSGLVLMKAEDYILDQSLKT